MNQENESFYEGKKILVTGGTGSIGSELVKRLLDFNPQVVRIFSNDENELYNTQQRSSHSNLRFLLGNIRDKNRMRMAMEDIDIVFHAAALKQVPLNEYNPFETVQTNVIGTQNVIDTALSEEVERVIAISTDKAVSPESTVGATKLLAERLITAANLYKGKRKTIFSCVRFGNVLDSRGSVIPVLKEQIQNGGPVTLTSPKMTRFIMSIKQAVELTLNAAIFSKGGEVFVLKMPSLNIKDLIDVLIQRFSSKNGFEPMEIEIKITGPRPGEKLYEELMTEDEAKRALETEFMYIILSRITSEMLHGIFSSTYPNAKYTRMSRYTSCDVPLLSNEEIGDLLTAVGVI